MFMFYLLLVAIFSTAVTLGMILISILARVPWGLIRFPVRMFVSFIAWMGLFFTAVAILTDSEEFYEYTFKSAPAQSFGNTALVLSLIPLLTIVQWIAFSKVKLEETEAAPKKKQLKGTTWRMGQLFRNFGLSLLLLVICYASFDYIVCTRMRSELAAAEARARQHLKPAIADEINANYYYKQAHETIGDSDNWPKWFKETSQLSTIYEAKLEKVRSFLNKHDMAIQFAIRGASQEKYQLINLEQPDNLKDQLDTEIFQPMNSSEQLLFWKAHLAIIDNDTEEFFETLNALLKMKKQRQNAFWGLQWLHTEHTNSRLVGVANHIIAKPEFSIEDSEFNRILEGIGDTSHYLDDIDEDEFSMIWVFYNIQLGEYDKVPEHLPSNVQKLPEFMKAAARLIGSFNRVFKASDGVFHVASAYDEYRDILASSTDSQSKRKSWWDIHSKSNGQTLTFMSGVHSLVDKPSYYAEEAHFSKNGFQIRKFHLKEKRYPKSWEELVPDYLPEIPVDIMTDLPLKLQVIPEGLIIYRIGKRKFS